MKSRNDPVRACKAEPIHVNAVQHPLRRLAATAILLATCWLGGCACHTVNVDHCAGDSFVVWPCFGYHSTCWRPWPGECIACPSPFTPVELPPSETVPSPMPGLSPMPLPAPEAAPPVPDAPPADPPAGDNSLLEPSSRRRAESQVHYLETLRWAPADSR